MCGFLQEGTFPQNPGSMDPVGGPKTDEIMNEEMNVPVN
jgi:hypothetical protein